MQVMRYFLSVIVAVMVASAASAQHRLLSLRECLEQGLENNYEILIQRNEERISDNNATRASAGMLPTLDLSAGYAGSADRTTTNPKVVRILLIRPSTTKA